VILRSAREIFPTNSSPTPVFICREKAEACTFAQRLSNCRRDGIFEAPRIFELQITYFCKLHLTLPKDSSTLLRRKL